MSFEHSSHLRSLSCPNFPFTSTSVPLILQGQLFSVGEKNPTQLPNLLRTQNTVAVIFRKKKVYFLVFNRKFLFALAPFTEGQGKAT